MTVDKELLRKKIPFLQEIPDGIYSRLDTSELYLPDRDVVEVREELERLLGLFVMTYNSSVFNLSIPLDAHLCANLKGANLTDTQLRMLRDYEERVRPSGVSLVAYQKPIEIIDPLESSITRLYS